MIVAYAATKTLSLGESFFGDDLVKKAVVSFHLPTDPDDQCFSAGQNILSIERGARNQSLLAENQKTAALASLPAPIDSFIKRQAL